MPDMNLVRTFRPRGAMTATHIPGHQVAPRPPRWPAVPAGVTGRRWWNTQRLEALLHLRLAAKGFYRGLMEGRGVIGVARLHATVFRADGRIEHLGLISTKVITDAGVAFLVDDWDANGQDLTNFKYHGCGTGGTAEAAGDTALVTESTTALNPDNTRATGTGSQPSAPQYRSVGTVTFDATAAITEHGIFSQAATGGGTLWDRSLFSAINVVSGDSIQFTYTVTLSSGG